MNRTKKLPFISTTALTIVSLLCVLPFILIISISMSNEEMIKQFGYSFIPRKFDFGAYAYIFSNMEQIKNAYIVTTLSTIIGTVLSVLVMSLMAYPLSQRSYPRRKPITFIISFTMLFSGGLVPTYILITQYLHLKDNFWVLILPSLVSVFHVILLRTFFQDISQAIIESARIDGSSEFFILFKILLPLSKPALATVALMGMLTRWGDWYNCLLYINTPKLRTLQYLLQEMMKNVEMMKSLMVNLPLDFIQDVPTESARMAMAIVTAGPMIFVFPFFQKYFVSGLTVGAVKG